MIVRDHIVQRHEDLDPIEDREIRVHRREEKDIDPVPEHGTAHRQDVRQRAIACCGRRFRWRHACLRHDRVYGLRKIVLSGGVAVNEEEIRVCFIYAYECFKELSRKAAIAPLVSPTSGINTYSHRYGLTWMIER